MSDTLSLLFKLLVDSSQAREDMADFATTAPKQTAKIKDAATSSNAAIASSAANLRNEITTTNKTFAASAQSASALGRELLNLTRGNILGAIESFGTFTSATNRLTVAQGELAAASGLSFGAIGLGILAIGGLTIGLLKWLNTEQEIITVSKEQIEATQKRIELLKRELDVTLNLAAASGDEAAKRQLVIDAKRKELAQNIEEQRIQEYALVNALIKALDAQEQAEIRLNNARISAIQTGGDWESTIEANNDALKEKEKKLKEAVDAVDVYTKATGRSRDEIFAHVLAQAKESDALGKTHHFFEDLVSVLGLTIDAQGRLVPSTDAVTAAINRQTDAIRKQNQELEARAKNRETTIRTNVEQIADMGLSDAQARRELARRRADSLFVDSPYGALDSAIKKNQQVSRLTDTLNNIISPPKGAADKARRDAIAVLEQQLKGIEDKYKFHTERLAREYKLELTDLNNFVESSVAQEDKRYYKTKGVLEKQQKLSKPGSSEYEKYRRELEKAETDHTKRIQQINDDANQKRIDALKAHQDELLKLAQNFETRYAASARDAADSRRITYEDAEKKILDFQTAIFDERLTIITAQEQKYVKNGQVINEELFRYWNDAHKRVIEEQVAFQEESDRRLDEAYQKDIDNIKRITDALYNTELEYEQRARDSYRRQLDDYAKFAARHLILTRQQHAQLIYARAAFDQEEETARHVKEMAQLRADEAALKRLAVTEKERLNIEKVYNGLREAEEQRHVDEQNRINRQADEETKKTTTGDEGGGLFGGIKKDLNDIPDLSPAVFAANAVTTAYLNMKQAVLDSVDAFIFSSATIGQVMRRAAAETLSSIAKEAAIQGLKQTALSLAALAEWDLRGFALHGLAAAAWFSVAGGSMYLGRAVMGTPSAGAALQQNTQPAARQDNPPPQVKPVKEEWRQIVIIEKRQMVSPPPGWVSTELQNDYETGNSQLERVLQHAVQRY